MKTSKFRSKGQSLVEFIIALGATVPLFLGIYYVGKYADIQQTAVQASRYAAFERVVRPDATKLSNAEIEDKMRARFFLRGDYLNQGEIRSNDSVKNVDAKTGQNPLWRTNQYGQLLKDYNQITLNYQQRALSGTGSDALRVAEVPFNVSTPPIQIANVEVTLLNKLDFGTDYHPANIRIGATTAALGGALNAAGTSGVQNAIDRPTATFDSLLPAFIGTAASTIIGLFEDNAPEFNCHRVEYVPRDRLSAAGGGGACR